MRKFRWGILGCGRHARRIAAGIAEVDDAEVYAAASRTPGKAAQFCEEIRAGRAYDTYEALLADPNVDAVFITTTNQLHCEDAILALKSGKPVVCEKPLAVNAAQVEQMIRTARECGVFFMEAMWSRFFPAMQRTRKLVQQGVIGRVQMIRANYGYRMTGHDLSDPSSRIFDPSRGGGSLLDVGVYPLYFSSMLAGGEPEQISGMMHPTPLGIDAHCAATVRFRSGVLASILSGIDGNSDTNAWVYGSEGYLRIPAFYKPDTLHIFRDGEPEETLRFPYAGNGYQFELMHAQDCIRAGKLESDIMPLDESLRLCRTLDTLRRDWDLKYPFEQ